jgi:hypothetical protein
MRFSFLVWSTNLVTVWNTYVTRRVWSRLHSHLGIPNFDSVSAIRLTGIIQMFFLASPNSRFTIIHFLAQRSITYSSGKETKTILARKQPNRIWEQSALHPYISRPTDCRPTRSLTKRPCFSRRGGMVHKTTTLHNALYLSRWQGAVVPAEALSDTHPLLNSIWRLGHCHHANLAESEFHTQDAICEYITLSSEGLNWHSKENNM